ncbi:hypothetical protein [Hyphomicrobium sp.]|jgi:hypothetical protein|uniref:hypothetical protein n=1 Tax=Hyphomicrobium sp. TaxID=82 RepID=UPI0035667B42
MSVGTTINQSFRQQTLSSQRLATIAVLVVLSLLSITLFHASLRLYFIKAAPHSAPIAFAPLLVSALACLFLHLNYSTLVPVMRIALRSSSLGLLTYLLVEPPDLTLAATAFAGDAQYISVGYYFAVACGIASIFSPALNIPVAIYILSSRLMMQGIAGMSTSLLDIRYMVDMTIYLTVFSMIVTRWGSIILPQWDQQELQEDVTFIAFGLHLGNYFWSAIAKAAAGPHLWTWIVENQTQNLIPYAFDKGALPIAQWPSLVQAVYDGMHALAVPLNLVIFGFQLFAICCVWRLSWLKVATVFYDMFHIGIFVMGGLFFWPWIWNNFTVLLAAYSLKQISNSAKLACFLTIALGIPALHLYKPARLGWFDVADARQSYFEAVTDTGKARVPASFFLSQSFGVSLGYMDTASHAGQYDYTPWNAARAYSRQLTSGYCPPPEPAVPASIESDDAKAKRLERIGRFVRAHHAEMLQREATLGRYNYLLRVHHQPSNPYLYREFTQIPLKDVRAYNLVVESVCYKLEDGQLKRTVVGHTADRIDVR